MKNWYTRDVKKEIPFLIVLFLLPVGVHGIGLASGINLAGNISVADFFFVILVGYLFLTRKRYLPKSSVQKKIGGEVIRFEFLFAYLAALSIWNLFRFTSGNRDVFAALLSLLKILICLAYSYVFMIYLRSCSQESWRRFISVAAASGFVFSLSCIVGTVMYFAGKPTVFIAYYVTSFRASGLLHDPSLSAIFQIMSISYVLAWMRFTRRRILKTVVLLCVIAGSALTASKSGVITLAVCTVIALLLSAIARSGKFVLRLIALIVTAVAAVAVLTSHTHFLDFMMERLGELLSGNITTALTQRDIIWAEVFDILCSNPLNLLFGVGIGQYGRMAGIYNLTMVSDSASNTLLSFWVECGIVMLLLVIALFAVLLYKLARNAVEKKDRFSLYMFWGILAIAIFMNSLNFQNNRMAYVFITFVFVSMNRMDAGEIRLDLKKE